MKQINVKNEIPVNIKIESFNVDHQELIEKSENIKPKCNDYDIMKDSVEIKNSQEKSNNSKQEVLETPNNDQKVLKVNNSLNSD